MMYKVFKRLFDFCSSAALLLALSPLVLVLCLLVRARLGAPVFFKQKRTGRYGRPFTILKFRTMTDARDERGNLLPDEQRVTALGRFLRSTSLDELPELWNILRGDMSVIGPRSLPVEYDAYYTEDERRRFCVRGGLIPPDTLTHNPFISWDEQLACEADYAMHLSLGRDVRIFLEVFKMLFRRDSADYGSYVRASLNEERAGREQVVKKKMCVITTIETTMETFVVPAMERFVAEGHEVTLVCKMSEAFIQKYSPRFHCVNMDMHRGIALGDLFVFPFRFWKLFRKEHFDYVQYATTNASFYAAWPARCCGILVRVYCQWGILYVGYEGWKRSIFKWVEKKLCRVSTHVTSASWKNLEYAVEEGLVEREQISVIGDGGTVGVDLSVFDVSHREAYREQVEREYPMLKGKTVFGYVGRIEKDKGVADLLRAFLSLDAPDAALLLIGGFDELRSGFDKELMAQAKACPRIVFHGFTRDVPRYLSALDVMVHPTYREGFSMVLQQGMAMGCAILTTDIPGPSEVIEAGRSGLLVPPKDERALAEAMSQLLADSSLRARFAQEGLTRVRTLFNRERMVELTWRDRMKMMNLSV
ncbi:MAG: sugar transferase [Bacteroidales bacterium]|nr:sugar transferase [Bacteroidales bacterium]